MKGLLLDTDILFEHLIHDSEKYFHPLSLLEILLSKDVCFTSVINAAELFTACENRMEKQAVRTLLNGLNVLGVHSRYALEAESESYSGLSSSQALFIATASVNKMKIATLRREEYPEGIAEFADLKLIVSGVS